MITIERAVKKDAKTIVEIGSISVKQAHLGSCPEEELDDYMSRNYNEEVIRQQLEDEQNVYHVLYYDQEPAGFTKLVLNEVRPEIKETKVAKLDRIYLLPSFFDKKLGAELLQYNAEYAKKNGQSGLWLVTWVGNERAIRFYTRAGFTIIGSYQFQVTPTTSNQNHLMYLPI